ncbi:PAC2 family-domain-containing protein [Gymnopilus junonius]|uniref:Proteasome assembly chaperone 2 n=1 Tax=Gymnopilus junonius TaxID=109634 RepID=A0A9P5NN45_GYMJU|nr:PAC2 family-domain-containing protein [Gymnopilus junonius]
MALIRSPISLQLNGKVIIIPIVSTANIGQLAVDLIVSSFSLERVAILNPKYCVPVVGAREDGKKGITTPLELYGHPDVDFVVVQQRSPVLKSLKTEFVEALLEFIKATRFSAVLFLSGVDLSNRTDAQMMTPTYQIRPEHGPNLAGTPLQKLSSLPIPTYTSPVQQPVQSKDGLPIPFIPGGGLTRRILSSIPAEWNIPTVCLLQFVLEGDNRADAGLFASVIAKVVDKDVPQWRQPGSWKAGLFGTPHDQTLYG